MARRGRPRKAGVRQPNGQLKRPTLAQLKEADFEQRMAERAHAAKQPHRAWYVKDPFHHWLATALGRFCLRYGLREEIKDAGDEWERKFRRLMAAKGVPDPKHQFTIGTGGAGPSASTVDTWEIEIERIEGKILEYGQQAYIGVRHLVIDDSDLPEDHDAVQEAIVGLRVVTVELGRLPKGAHPFVDAVYNRRAA